MVLVLTTYWFKGICCNIFDLYVIFRTLTVRTKIMASNIWFIESHAGGSVGYW